MKKRLTIEISLVIGVALSSFLVGLILFRNKLFDGKDLDIQFHDTYIVLPKTFILLVIFTILLMLIYFVRAIYHKLNSKPVNVILGTLLILALTVLVMYVNWLDGYESHMRALYSEQFGDDSNEIQIEDSLTRTRHLFLVVIGLISAILVAIVMKTVKLIRKRNPSTGAQHGI